MEGEVKREMDERVQMEEGSTIDGGRSANEGR